MTLGSKIMELHPGVGAGGGSTTFQGEIKREARKLLPEGAQLVSIRPMNEKCEHGLRLYEVLWRPTRKTATAPTVAELRALAVGMPYRSEATKDELLDWLQRYRPEALAEVGRARR